MTKRGSADYLQRQAVAASRERVFAALTTLDGLRGWWTPIVSGAAQAGGEVTFGFEGLDETIVMRVDETNSPAQVRWTCLRHSSLPEWSDTSIEFALVDMDGETELRLRHRGLTPALECYDHCEVGWNHFLASIAAYVEDGQGMPFRGERLRTKES